MFSPKKLISGKSKHSNQQIPQTQTQSQLPPPQQSNGFNQGNIPVNNREHQRKLITDKIILDCYSKTIVQDGKKMHETSYISHIGVIEYSNYPSQPPPERSENVGSQKKRILVLCSKYSGRLQLQKGKCNEKNIYQIGRTWDLSELQCIRKVGNNAMVLQLNKNYYWKCDEEDTRTWKFCRYLCQEYGNYMSHYPRLEGGFTLDDFMLPSTPKTPRSPASNSRSSSIKDKLKNKGRDLYKDMDFTSHGQLPVKPMKIISRDAKLDSGFQSYQAQEQPKPPIQRQSQNSSQVVSPPRIKQTPVQSNYKSNSYHSRSNSQHEFDSTPYESKFQPSESRIKSNPEPKFQPIPEPKFQPIPEPKFISNDESKFNLNTTSPDSRNYESKSSSNSNFHPQSRTSPKKSTSQPESHEFRIPSHPYASKSPLHDDSHSFIFTDVDSTKQEPEHKLNNHQEFSQKSTTSLEKNKPNAYQEFAQALPPRKLPTSPDFGIEEITDESDTETSKTKGLGISHSARSSQFIEESTKNNDMQELEDMLDSHLNDDSFQFHDEKSIEEPDIEQEVVPLNIVKKEEFERDAEVDEIFEEINWSVKSDTDSIVKSLTKEMNKVKQETVKKLINVDLSNNHTNDIGSAIDEVDNMKYVFQKMDSNLKFILPQIEQIDKNGLQIRYINKKLLYNDLKGLLDKVNVDHDKLRDISEFKSFDNIEKIHQLESKLVNLYNATIRYDNDGMSSLKALQQYQSGYDVVNKRFVKHFIQFVKGKFDQCQAFNFDHLLDYCGLTFYTKEVSPVEFQQLNHYFNQIFEKKLESQLDKRVVSVEIEEEAPRRRTTRRKVNSVHLESIKKQWKKKDDQVDAKVIIDLIQESKEIIHVFQNFIGKFFHYYDGDITFVDYIEHVEHESTATNSLVTNLTTLFGNYINNFLKLGVSELNLPSIILYIEQLETDEEFVRYNFLDKIAEKYKNQWNKFMQLQVESLNNSTIVAKSGVLQSVKNINYVLYYIDNSIRDLRGSKFELNVGEALINLFMREDPLLKNSDLDDKEREFRNVSILQNIFYTIQQVSDLSGHSKLTEDLTKVFKKVERDYFQKQMNKTVGKLITFVDHPNKKQIKGLLSNYTQKDIQSKVGEIYKKMMLHFKLEDQIFEKDLMDRLWSDLELIFIDLFTKLNNILRHEKDIDYHVGRADIHHIFKSVL